MCTCRACIRVCVHVGCVCTCVCVCVHVGRQAVRSVDWLAVDAKVVYGNTDRERRR